MQTEKTVSYIFTKKEVEQILIDHVEYLTGSRANKDGVNWKIIEGDKGSKILWTILHINQPKLLLLQSLSNKED